MVKWSAAALVAILALVLAASGVSRGPGSGPLSEREIKSVIMGSLPRATVRFDRITYDGNGAVVAGKATRGKDFTFFQVVSGDPGYRGRHIPKHIVAPPGSVEGDLVIRVAQGRRGPGPDPNLGMSVTIEFALCDYRIGGECGV